jgi:hypothetical protein
MVITNEPKKTMLPPKSQSNSLFNKEKITIKLLLHTIFCVPLH